MTGLPKHTPLTVTIVPENLPTDLRRRAQSLRLLARSRGDLIDAQYLCAAADEIDRLRAEDTRRQAAPKDESPTTS